jgi:NAD kinase
MVDIEKIVIITKKTWLEELTFKFNTKAQANFYIVQNQSVSHWNYYEDSHNQYQDSLGVLKKSIPTNLKVQVIDRSFLPNFLFGRTDLIVVIGPDGLVVNTAKYLDNQYILAINPDPERISGVLLPFRIGDFKNQLKKIESGKESLKRITMAEAILNDNQRIFGVNDLFVGHQSHMSARYSLEFQGRSENQSSSGIIISTGAGSTGWYRSVVTGALGISQQYRGGPAKPLEDDYRFDWSSDYLKFSVREPWPGDKWTADIVHGTVYKGDYLTIESKMPEGGRIFSDGIQEDYLQFNSGLIAKVGVSDKKVNLLV